MSTRCWSLLALGALAVATVGSAAAEPTAASGRPLYPPAGLDMTGSDPTVRPGNDFFQFATGGWMANTQIAADKPQITEAQAIRDRTEAQLRGLIEAAAATAGHQPESLQGKVGAFYRAFMDESRIEALGIRPLSAPFAAIRASRTRAELAGLMGASLSGLGAAFFGVNIDLDLKDPAHYAVYIQQAGLSMPDRDYYLQAGLAGKKRAFHEYVERLLTLSHWSQPRQNADAIVALETRIAEVSWTKAEQRELPKTYNPFAPRELQAFAPGFDWPAYLRAAGLGGKTRIVVAEKSAFPKIAQIFATTPVDTLKAWLAFAVADSAAPYLSQPLAAARFEFRRQTLLGVRDRPARWKEGVAAVAGGDCLAQPSDCFGTLDWAVGQLYTARYFPASTKASIQSLVADLTRAFRHRIEQLDWMGESTRAEALRKLDSYQVKVGYPDKPRNYSALVVRDNDLLGNVRRAAAADWEFLLRRSDGPVDQSDWIMTPQTVDAYNGSLRDIVFPAAILQAPFFDPNADPAVNFAGIGATIGHELTHGFDDQGRTIDSSGGLRDWWTETDASAFKARAAVLGAQFGSYEPVAGLHINPDLTMGENLADLGGLAIALDAYRSSLGGAPAPVIDGLSGEQRFFRAYAQAWRGKAREDYIRDLTVSNPHSYRKFRVNGIVRNLDAWYPAFDVQRDDALYVEPAKRARVW